MALKLRVVSDQYKQLGAQRSRMFGVTGGTIGRAADNDWVLPDTHHFISSRHATVSFRAGAWLLEDTSRNGVFLNDSDTPLSDSGPAKLSDGDRLKMGEYDLLVVINDHNDFSPDASGQMPIPAALRSPSGGRKRREEAASRKLGPQRSKVEAKAEPKAPHEIKLDAFLQPDLEVTDLLIPPKRKAKQSQTPTTSTSNSASVKLLNTGFEGVSEALIDFCHGLGVDPTLLPRRSQTALLTAAGQLLRETAQQLTRTLERKQERIESETQNAPESSSTSPLLNSPSFESTLRRLLEAPGMDGRSGVEALRISFDQIRNNDEAFDAAVARALDEMLVRLDPARLSARVDQSTPSSPFGGNKKAKYWDAFSELFAAIDQRDGRGWPTLFAREFAKALAAELRERS